VSGAAGHGPHYKWIALSNTTLGVLMATINSSIMLIALPDIFKGIRLDPLQPGNVSYLLWLILGFLVVTAVLVVSLGRIGDMFGRVKMYNLGFAIFTFFSILLSITWMHGTDGALWLIIIRVFQGVGGAFLFANSSAILTDAFPEDQRGLALGINAVAAISGSFIGLVLGGLLGPVNWRLVFLVSVPFGLFGTVWAYLKLRDTGVRQRAKLDWWGNVTFAVGLIAVLVGITYGIQPYGGHNMGWTSPKVLTEIIGGIAVLIIFAVIETRVDNPMFHLKLFRIRAFTFGNIASLLSSLGRGGLQFILIIWLQGIWLPLHGYSFDRTPLWAGIYMLPLTAGFLLAAPISGILSDRFGARPFATGGMIIAAGSFVLMNLLPVNFSYVWFALILVLNGLGMGLFASPNRAGIMNSLPPTQRGVGAGMTATFQNSATVLSIGVFFSLIILGLSDSLPQHLYSGLTAQGVPSSAAHQISALPPVSTLFAALLGYNPIQTLLQQQGVAGSLSQQHLQFLTSRSYFPHLIAEPFQQGLGVAFAFAIAACLVAAIASYLRGGKYHYIEGAEHRAPVAVGVARHAVHNRESAAGEPVPAVPSPPAPSPPVPSPPAAVDRGGRLSGAVRQSGGRPVRDVRLTLIDAGGRQAGRARTAADGSYDLTVPEPGQFLLIVQAPGFQPQAATLQLGNGPTEHSVVVAGAGGLAGTVSTAGAGPRAGVTVTVADVRGEVVGSALTGADGGFGVAELMPGTYTVVASAASLRPAASMVTVPASGVVRHDVELAGGGSVRGTVAGPGGRPLADVAIRLAGADGRLVAQGCTDGAGGYAFADVPAGEYTVTAAHYRPASVPVRLSVDRQQLDLSLRHETGPRAGGPRTGGPNGVPIAP
jgi:MFS family permease